LLGPANHSAKPSSSTSAVCGWRTRRNAAKRGLGRGGAIRSSTDPAAGPEMRITATPARPWPLERAKMVAWSVVTLRAPPAQVDQQAYLSCRLARLDGGNV